MLTVPKQIAIQRWDTLPDVIRETLVSEHSVEILDRIAKDEHIPEDKIPLISQVAGYVLMGFLHPEEAVTELKERLGIDGRIAESISKSLDTRIFSPLKSQIEKLYAPAFDSSKPMPRGPVMIAEDATLTQKKTVAEKPAAPQWRPPAAPRPPQAGGTPPPKMMNEISGQELGDLGSNRMAVKEVEPPRPAPAFRPSTPSAPARPVTVEIRPPVNVSKDASDDSFGIVEEIKKLEHSGAELVDVLKKKDIQSKDDRNTIETQSKDGGNVAEIRLKYGSNAVETKLGDDGKTMGVKKEPQLKYDGNTMETQLRDGGKPAGFSNQATGPVIIHQESDQEPIRPMSSFHLEPPASQFSSPVSKNESRSVARVEFGGEKHLPDILAKTDVIKPPRVVHYNTFQTPLENPPGVSVPKAPSFSPPTPIMRSEMPMPQFGKTQQSTAPVSLQFPTISKIQGPQKIATVNYGADSLPSEGGPASLNSVFSKPAEKHSSWLRSIFSKKSETPAQEISFTPPTPPLPRPPQPRPASGTIPQPGITLQPTVPQIPQSPTQQKTSDIKMNEPQGGPKKENSNPREEMIDLDNMKIKK